MNSRIAVSIYCLVLLFTTLIMCSKEQKNNTVSKFSDVKDASAIKVSTSGNYNYTVSIFRRNVSWSKDDSLWAPVSNGLIINCGAWAETGELSSLTLNGSLGDVVMMGEKAKVHLLIDDLKSSSGQASLAMRGLQLLKGTVRFAIHKDPAGFLVKTSSATIKVKGTQFIVSCDEKSGRTDVKVLEGVVEIFNDAAGKTAKLLYKSEVLSGIDKSGNEQMRSLQANDTIILRQFINNNDSGLSGNQTVNKNNDDKYSIKKELDKSSSKNSLSSIKTKAEKIIDSTRTVSQKAIDSVQKDHAQAVNQENKKFGNYKTAQEIKIDSTRTAAQNNLDKERASFESKRTGAKDSINKNSDKAFDELHSRMKGR